MTLSALDPYRRGPGGPARCKMCGHRTYGHESTSACLRAALLAISDALKEDADRPNAAWPERAGGIQP